MTSAPEIRGFRVCLPCGAKISEILALVIKRLEFPLGWADTRKTYANRRAKRFGDPSSQLYGYLVTPVKYMKQFPHDGSTNPYPTTGT